MAFSSPSRALDDAVSCGDARDPSPLRHPSHSNLFELSMYDFRDGPPGSTQCSCP